MVVLQDKPLEFKGSDSGGDVEYDGDVTKEEGDEAVEDQNDERRAKETGDLSAEEVKDQSDEEVD